MPRHPSKEDWQTEISRERETERTEAKRRIAEGDPPWDHEVGVVAVVDAVRDQRFPTTSQHLAQDAGQRYIRASDRLTVPLSEILAHMPERDFETIKEFQRAVQKHWPGVRYLEVPEEQRSPKGGFQPTQRKKWPHRPGA